MKTPWVLRDEAERESYEYFDKHIRHLPKGPDGVIQSSAPGFQDNDVDAFRHAYVSGVFTQDYSDTAADLFGRMNEFFGPDIYSNSRNPRALNMDLWNNGIGRKYGKRAKSRDELLKMIHGALRNGELITNPNDSREYKGAKRKPGSADKPVIAIGKSKTGGNELFLDTIKKKAFTRDEFIARIQAGEYPGYTIKTIKGQPTPVSNPDGRRTNNLS